MEGLKSSVACIKANEAMWTGKKINFKPSMFEV
jgi:hypothetical protein